MGDLDDGPDQQPLDEQMVQDTVLKLLPVSKFDFLITHGQVGEYTRHIRHEETGQAVMALWESGRLSAREVWRFAYEDGGGAYLPQPAADADIMSRLPQDIWQEKYRIITEIYGFDKDSFEGKTTPKSEAFRRFQKKADVLNGVIEK
jgi:hypothetical protein